MQQTPASIEQIKALYSNTNLPAALYDASGAVLWQNSARPVSGPAIPWGGLVRSSSTGNRFPPFRKLRGADALPDRLAELLHPHRCTGQ